MLVKYNGVWYENEVMEDKVYVSECYEKEVTEENHWSVLGAGIVDHSMKTYHIKTNQSSAWKWTLPLQNAACTETIDLNAVVTTGCSNKTEVKKPEVSSLFIHNN